jgi:hydrogenase expression/formation protein HypD
MRFVDEYRNAELGRAVAGEIVSIVEPGREYKLMEVCGGHTHTIYKYGVDDLLPANVELVHGPGCRPPRRRCLFWHHAGSASGAARAGAAGDC